MHSTWQSLEKLVSCERRGEGHNVLTKRGRRLSHLDHLRYKYEVDGEEDKPKGPAAAPMVDNAMLAAPAHRSWDKARHLRNVALPRCQWTAQNTKHGRIAAAQSSSSRCGEGGGGGGGGDRDGTPTLPTARSALPDLSHDWLDDVFSHSNRGNREVKKMRVNSTAKRRPQASVDLRRRKRADGDAGKVKGDSFLVQGKASDNQPPFSLDYNVALRFAHLF